MSNPLLPDHTIMRFRNLGSDCVVRAPAKINLFLEVLGKRPDGYHDIATLMATVSLWDLLSFTEDTAGRVQLACDRADLSTGPDNLIVKAARLLQARTGCTRGASIRLRKRIPMAAGLAGGSTDAAATLAGLNRLWGLGLADAELAEMSGAIGSDIPFFFSAPAAWCTGRGEKVEPVKVGRALDLVLVCPPVGLATAAVYQGVVVPDQPRAGSEIRQALEAGDIEAIGRGLCNRLQASAEKLCPPVARAYEKLERLRPAGQLMSGSGSSLFALCRDRSEAERIVQQLRQDPDLETTQLYLVRSGLSPAPPHVGACQEGT